MADYLIQENPVYTIDIRRLENSDPANAALFNELFEKLIQNTHAVKLEAGRKSDLGHTHLPGDCGLGKTLTLTGAATATYNGQTAETVLIPDRKGCRFIVGTSTNGWTAKDCDYLCDGTDDQVEINAAINALPSTGGEVVILDGTYNIALPIKINKSNVTLQGCGNNTILERKWNNGTSYTGVIFIEKECVCVQSLRLNGNKDDYANSCGITLGGSSSYTNRKYITISEVTLKDFKYGIVCTFSEIDLGIFDNIFFTCDNGIRIGGNKHYKSLSIISNNRFFDCSSFGIDANFGDYIIISNNMIANYNVGGSGITLSVSNYANIVGNIILNKNTGTGISANGKGLNIDGNICKDCSSGITVFGSESSIRGNICIDFDVVGIQTYSANRCLINENVCIRNNGTASDYTSSQNTINISSGDSNLIANNFILGKNYVNSGTGNTFANNKYN